MTRETLQKAKELDNKLNDVKALLNAFDSSECALIRATADTGTNVYAEATMAICSKDDFIGAKFKALLVQYEEYLLNELDKL